MTNAKVHNFCDDKKVEEHCPTFNKSSNIGKKGNTK